MRRRTAVLALLASLAWVPQLCAQNAEGPSEGGALLRSLIMPGWGQHVLGDHRAARKLALVETGLWLSYAVTRGAAGWYQQDYRAFAALHAGIDYSLEPDKFYIFYYRLGRYDSIYEYNQVQLRQRSISDIYRLGEGNNWQWDDPASRERYNDLRRASLMAAKGASFILGGMVVNRAVAAIHVLFLSRLEVAVSARWTPLPGGGRVSVDLLR